MNRDHTGSILQLPLVFTPRANKGFNGASRTPFKRLATTPQCSIPCKLNSWASTLACPKQGSLAGSSLIRPSVGSAWCECLGEVAPVSEPQHLAHPAATLPSCGASVKSELHAPSWVGVCSWATTTHQKDVLESAFCALFLEIHLFFVSLQGLVSPGLPVSSYPGTYRLESTGKIPANWAMGLGGRL